MAKTTKLDMPSAVIMRRAGTLGGVNTCGTPAVTCAWHWGMARHRCVPPCRFASVRRSGSQRAVRPPADPGCEGAGGREGLAGPTTPSVAFCPHRPWCHPPAQRGGPAWWPCSCCTTLRSPPRCCRQSCSPPSSAWEGLCPFVPALGLPFCLSALPSVHLSKAFLQKKLRSFSDIAMGHEVRCQAQHTVQPHTPCAHRAPLCISCASKAP